MNGYLLPVYLLLLAGFLLILNTKSAPSIGKWLSYVCMWAAIVGSAVTALGVYR